MFWEVVDVRCDDKVADVPNYLYGNPTNIICTTCPPADKIVFLYFVYILHYTTGGVYELVNRVGCSLYIESQLLSLLRNLSSVMLCAS